MEKELKLLGNTEVCTDEVVDETATLISSSYGFKTNNMMDCRINSYYQKTSKPRKLLYFSEPYHHRINHLDKQ